MASCTPANGCASLQDTGGVEGRGRVVAAWRRGESGDRRGYRLSQPVELLELTGYDAADAGFLASRSRGAARGRLDE
jgi:hypothetical protein